MRPTSASLLAACLTLPCALASDAAADPVPPPTLYRVVAFGAGAGEAERLSHCSCVTSAGRPDLCVPASAWDPLVAETGRVYASGCEYQTPDAVMMLLYYSCGGPGHTAYQLHSSGPTVATILASGQCDPNGAVHDAQAAVACAYVNGEMPAPSPPRGAFGLQLDACQPGGGVAAKRTVGPLHGELAPGGPDAE
jgi:hypothetical protein